MIRNTAERNSADAARAEFRAERPPRFFCADCDECFQRRLELQKRCKLANAKPDKESGEKHNAHQLFRLKRLKGDKEAQMVARAPAAREGGRAQGGAARPRSRCS